MCGGTFKSMHLLDVIKQVVGHAGNNTLKQALDAYMKPLEDGDLALRTLVETNPLGAKAASAISFGGTHYTINQMDEGLVASFRHMAQKELAHLNYQLRMASQKPKLMETIAAEIGEIESAYAEGDFPDAALDPVMRAYALLDEAQDKRASDVTSTMQVSDFAEMPRTTAFDEFHAASANTANANQYKEFLELGQVRIDQGPIMAWAIIPVTTKESREVPPSAVVCDVLLIDFINCISFCRNMNDSDVASIRKACTHADFDESMIPERCKARFIDGLLHYLTAQ